MFAYMHGIAGLRPSDVFLLANTNYVPEYMDEFKRGTGARYCPTPFFYEAING